MAGLIVMAVVLGVLGLSVALLQKLKPGWKMSRRVRKFVLTLHVGVSVGWLGAAIAMLVLSIAALATQDLDLRRSAYAFMHIYDLAIMVPLGFLSLFTGVALSAGTNWGLFKHWWIVVKLVLTVAVLTFAGVFTNVWVLEAAEQTARNPSIDLGVLGVQVLANAVAFNLVFWTTTTLSTYKPWGNTPYGLRQAPKRPAVKRTARPYKDAPGPREKGA